MIKQIWKFKVGAKVPIEIEMPIGAEVLAVQMQGVEPCIWVLVEPKAKTETKYFTVVGTGQNCQVAPKDHIGTFQAGDLVWHLFEGIIHDKG